MGLSTQSNLASIRRQTVHNPVAAARVAAALAPVSSSSLLEDAQRHARQLTRTHYENFSVVSWLLPRHLRQDFCNVYVFCRIADDIADELGDSQKSLEGLEQLRQRTRECYAGMRNTRLFSALGDTIDRHQIPVQPFLDLINAFEQDQRQDRYQSFEDLVDYCRRSADPVGRLVLYMCGYRDAERQRLSDLTCTALQLTNFWQDVRRDLEDRNRIYLPRQWMDRFAVSDEQLRERDCTDAYRSLIRHAVDRTEAMFAEGEQLLEMLNPQVRRHIGLFGKGGMAILEAIRRNRFDTLTHRPTLSRWQKTRLAFSAMGAGFALSWPAGAAA